MKILWKKPNGFCWNWSTTSQIITIHHILEGVHAENLKATHLFVDFSKVLNSIDRGKMEQILLAYDLCRETLAAIIMLYKNAKVKVHSLDGDIAALNSGSLKLVDKFTYLGRIISSSKNDINMQLAKTWTAINRLLIIWKSDPSDKIKGNFFQAAVMTILLYGCTTWKLTKCIEK